VSSGALPLLSRSISLIWESARRQLGHARLHPDRQSLPRAVQADRDRRGIRFAPSWAAGAPRDVFRGMIVARAMAYLPDASASPPGIRPDSSAWPRTCRSLGQPRPRWAQTWAWPTAQTRHAGHGISRPDRPQKRRPGLLFDTSITAKFHPYRSVVVAGWFSAALLSMVRGHRLAQEGHRLPLGSLRNYLPQYNP
jgi:hypothetical protein